MAEIVDCLKADGALSAESGAKNLLFRQIFAKNEKHLMSVTYNDILPGGNSKKHSHKEEHIAFIVQGKGFLEVADGKRLEIQTGSAIYIASDEPHCFFNTGTEKMVSVGILGPS